MGTDCCLINDPVLSVFLSAGGRYYLVDTVDTTGSPHTGEHPVSIATSQVEHIEKELAVNVNRHSNRQRPK